MRFVAGVMVSVCLLGVGSLGAQSSNAAKQVVDSMLTHESDPAEHRNLYMYLSEERSERTGGHLWRERVVETSVGKVRLLLAEDGKPLSGDRATLERAKLAQIELHPEEFQRRAQATKSDEDHAEQMLTLLGKAFLFNDPRVDGSDLEIGFRPDPAYKTQSLEERVLHAMSGTLLVDQRTLQLHMIEGKMPQDVSLGYGLLGTVHAGSSFNTTHEMEPGGDWKDAVVNTAIEGKAMLFKEIGRNEHMIHSEFQQLPPDISVAQAVEMLER
ncbi:hypothetical protein [Tunturiibacter gelidoferens]|jgi:hypothetical protein|uniref:Uncharacterized protein n=1 Tax=Tunturiibacter gelidiferens TaxID=3069689 RepID=A0A9X0QBV8_9BACT|nr:hypothetical protein [Edaphobacter lichenicola]MBB5327394.1 hypothetical protein [Edaphobacter lichenicola]